MALGLQLVGRKSFISDRALRYFPKSNRIASTSMTPALNTKNIILLNGDGVGPEVVGEAVKALHVFNEFSAKTNLKLEFSDHLIGGCAIDKTGVPLPDSTLDACRKADAILLGAVGGPQWPRPATAENPTPARPEQGLLKIRKELGLYANIRPCFFPGASLVSQSPLRPEIVSGKNYLSSSDHAHIYYF